MGLPDGRGVFSLVRDPAVNFGPGVASAVALLTVAVVLVGGMGVLANNWHSAVPPPRARDVAPASGMAAQPLPSIGSASELVAEQTLNLWDNKLTPGDSDIVNLMAAYAVTVDPYSDRLFVAGAAIEYLGIGPPNTPNGSYVDILNATTGAGVGSVANLTGGLANAMAYDPDNGNIYMATGVNSTGSPQILNALNGTTGTVVGRMPIGWNSTALLYDHENGRIYVANGGSNNISVLDPSTGGVVANISVASDPEALALDPSASLLFVAPWYSEFVQVINTTNDSIVATVPVGTHPDGIAYDPMNGNVFVANAGTANLTVFNAANFSTVTSIPLAYSPSTILYLPKSGDLSVAEGGFYGSAVQTAWIDGTNDSVLLTVTNAGVAMSYDPRNDLVDELAGGGVAQLDASNGSKVAEDGLIATPTWDVYDPANGDLYVADAYEPGIALVNTSATSLVGRVSTSTTMGMMLYDPMDRMIYATTAPPAAVDVINATTNRVVGTLPAGDGPDALALDPLTGDLYISNYYSKNITVVDPATGSSVGSVLADTEGWALTFDSADGLFWYINQSGIHTIDPGSGKVTHTWDNSSDYATLTYDPTQNEIFVQDAVGLFVLNGSSAATVAEISVPVIGEGDGEIDGMTFDPYNDHIYGLMQFVPAVVEIDGGSDRYVGSVYAGTGLWALALGGPADSLYASNYDSGTLTVLGFNATYNVTFEEHGLPSGTTWYLNAPGLAGAAFTSTSSMVLTAPNGTYAFHAYIATGAFQAIPASGQVTINGTNTTVSIVFSVAFPISFQEAGLPYGAAWGIEVSGPQGAESFSSTPSGIGFTGTNGSYNYSVASAPGYAPHPSAGSFAVQGGPVNITIDFTWLAGNSTVTFVESGLAAGTDWNVQFAGTTNGGTSSEVVFTVPPGNYSYAIAVPTGYDGPGGGPYENGWVQVNAPFVTVSVNFTTAGSGGGNGTYTITFHATGLPAGTGWVVVIGSQVESSEGSNAIFYEPNGTYGYVVLPLPGFFPERPYGTVTVHGSSTTVDVMFEPQTYPIVIVEFGLPNGTTWSVTLRNVATNVTTTASSNGSAIIFELPNGTYTISVALPSGYTWSSSSTTFVVGGAGVHPPTIYVSGRGSASASSAPWVPWAVVGVVAAAVGAATLVLGRRRRRGP